MEEKSLSRYADLMEEVKLRIALVERLMSDADKLPVTPRFEFAALQFRRVLELIAFGSLIANEKAYSAAYKRFSNEWNAKKLMNQMHTLNPNFYPTPVKQVKTDVPGILLKHEKAKDGFLTEAEFVTVYEKTSEIIHSPNPFAGKSAPDFPVLSKTYLEWRAKIIGLLNLHELHFVNDPGMAVCSMNDGGTDKVRVYRFAPPTVQ